MDLYRVAVDLSVIPEQSTRRQYLSQVLNSPNSTTDAVIAALFKRNRGPSDNQKRLCFAAILSYEEWSSSRKIPGHVQEIVKVSREIFEGDQERVEALLLAADCFKLREICVGIPYFIDLISLIPSHMRSLDVCLHCVSLIEHLSEFEACEELLNRLEAIPEAERVEIWKTVANWLSVPFTPTAESETVSATDEESDSSEDSPPFHPLDSSPVAGGLRVEVLDALVELGDKRHYYVKLVESLIGTERGQVVGEAVDTLLAIEMEEGALEKLCSRVIELTEGSTLRDRMSLLFDLSELPEEKREDLIAAAVNYREATSNKVSISFVVRHLKEKGIEERSEICQLSIALTAGTRRRRDIEEAFMNIKRLSAEERNAVSELAERLTNRGQRSITRLDLLPEIYPRFSEAECIRFFELLEKIGDHYLIHQLIATQNVVELLEFAAFMSEGKGRKEKEEIVDASLHLFQVVAKYSYPLDQVEALLPLLATTVRTEMGEEHLKLSSSVDSIVSDSVTSELLALFNRLEEDRSAERGAKRRRAEEVLVDLTPLRTKRWIEDQKVLPIGMIWLLINRGFFRG